MARASNRAAALLMATQLTIGFGRAAHRRSVLVQDIDLTADAGELVAIIGANGSGKTTLLRTLSGLLPRLGGDIYIRNRALHRLPPAVRAREIALVSATAPAPIGMTTFELVALGRHPYTGLWGGLRAADRAIVVRALRVTGATDYADWRVDRLSDGQLRRAQIAAAIAQETPLLLLDEPTAFLDADGRRAIFSLLRRLADEERRAILIATHEIGSAQRCADRMVSL